MSDFTPQDAEYLLGRPEFRRFLYVAIQSAGVIGHNPNADGRQERDLSLFEGRRSLGLELLQMADAGQPEPLRHPHALATLDAVFREILNPKEKPNGGRNRDRYDDIPE